MRVGGAGQVASRKLALGTDYRDDGNDDGDPERRRPWRPRGGGEMRMEDEPQGTVCRLGTPCTWGFQEIVLGGSPTAELRGIEAEGVSERDDRDPR